MKIGLCIAMCLTMAFAANIATAASRADFDQLVQQVEAKPTDTKLRERIIKMAQELKPAPAIPEEARRSFVQGNTFAKSAKDASGQKLAIDAYNDALKLAPWWGEAYYNLALVQELAGRFSGARASLKLYLLTTPSEQEAREANDRIYALEAKEKLAKAEKNDKASPSRTTKPAPAAVPAQSPADAKLALLRSLNGAKYFRRNEWSATSVEDEFWSISNDDLVVSRNQINPQEVTSFATPPEYWHWQDGEFRSSSAKHNRICISSNGQQLTNCLTGEVLGTRAP